MTYRQPKICVVGSINMDLTVETHSVPQKGETIKGQSFATYPGGKGANQAVAASRIGADVAMIGAVGKDEFGQSLTQHLKQENINTDGIATMDEASTGISNIIISGGDNRIIFISGANQHVTPELVESRKSILLASDIVLMQFEIPIETIDYTVKLAYENDIPTIVNPAPFEQLPDGVINKMTYMTPNDIEAEALYNHHQDQLHDVQLITTTGSDGVHYDTNQHETVRVPAFDVNPVDTTGAGDTFNGALAAMLGEGYTLKESITFANKASAMSISTLGAQNGMPVRQAVETTHLNLKHRM